MTKCANCAEDANFVYEVTSNAQLFFCEEDLPLFIRKFPLLSIEEFEFRHAPVELSTESSSKASRKKATIEEPTLAEEPAVPVEEPVVAAEEPAPSE